MKWRPHRGTGVPAATDAAKERARQEALLAQARRETAKVKRRAPEVQRLPADEFGKRLRDAMTLRTG